MQESMSDPQRVSLTPFIYNFLNKLLLFKNDKITLPLCNPSNLQETQKQNHETQSKKDQKQYNQTIYHHKISYLLQNIQNISLQSLADFFRRVKQQDLPKLNYDVLLLALAIAPQHQNSSTLTWKVFYQILNQVLRIKIRKYQKKMFQFVILLQNQDYSIFQHHQKAILYLQTKKNMKKYKPMAGHKSVQRIFNSMLCLSSLSVQQILKLTQIFLLKGQLQSKGHISTKSDCNDQNQVNDCTLKLRDRLYMQDPQNFTCLQIKTLIYLLIGTQFIEDFQKTFQALLKISNLMVGGQQTISILIIQKNAPQQIMQLMISILIKNEKIKMRKYFLCFLLQYIDIRKDRIYELVIDNFVTQADNQVAFFMQNYLQKQCLKILTISKLKNLMRNIRIFNSEFQYKIDQQKSQIYLQSQEQIKNSKSLQKRQQIVKQTQNQLKNIPQNNQFQRKRRIQTELIRIKSLLCIMDKMAQKFNDSSIQLIFQGNQSYFSVKQLKEVKSLIVLIDLHSQIDKKVRLMTISLSKQHKYTMQITMFPKLKTVQIHVLCDETQIISEKKNCWAGFQFFISFSFSKDKKQIGFSIDSTYYSIPLQKKDLHCNSVSFGNFKGVLKDFYLLKVPLNVATINKELIDRRRKIASLVQYIGVEHIITELKSGQKTIKQTKTKSPFWIFKNKEMRYESQNIIKTRSLNFIDSLTQVGGLKSLVFLIQRVNYQSNNDIQSVNVLEDFFMLLKSISLAYDISIVLPYLEECLSYFSEFFWLLVRRNSSVAKSGTMFTKALDFLMFYRRDLRHSPQLFTQEIRLKLQKIEQQTISKIFLNFQLWSYCSWQVQQLILKQLSRIFQSKAPIKQSEGKSSLLRYVKNSYLYQALIGTAFYFTSLSQNQYKNEQFCDNVFKVLGLLTDGYQLYQYQCDKNQMMKNRSLIKTLIQRDVNQILTILYSLFYKKFWPHQSAEVNVIINICKFIQQVYLDNIKNFGWLGHQHWPYIVYMLSKMVEFTPKSNDTLVINHLMKLIIKISCKQSHFNRFIYMFVKSLTKRAPIDDFSTIVLLYFEFIKQISKLKNRSASGANQMFIKFLNQRLNAIKQINNFERIETCILQMIDSDVPSLLINDVQFPTFLKNLSELRYQKEKQSLLHQVFYKIYQKETYKGTFLSFICRMIQEHTAYCYISQQSAVVNQAIIQNYHSAKILTFLIENGLIDSHPIVSINNIGNCNQEQLVGGTLAHYLALNQLDFEEVEIIASHLEIIQKQEKQDFYEKQQMKQLLNNQTNLVLFFAPYKLLAYVLFIHYQSVGITMNIQSSKRRKHSKEIKDFIDKRYLRIIFNIGNRISYRLLCFFKYFQKDLKQAYRQIKAANQIEEIEETKKNCALKLKRQLQIFKGGQSQFDSFARKFIAHIKTRDQVALSTFVNKNLNQMFSILSALDASSSVFINSTKVIWKIKKQQQNKNYIKNNPKIAQIERLIAKDFQSQKEKSLNSQKYYIETQDIIFRKFYSQIDQKFERLIEKLERDSHRNYQIWAKICKRNEFWIYQKGKKSSNAVYEVDPKQTGFYHLGVIQNTTRQPPYPRRRQFIQNNKNMLEDIQQTLFTDKIASKLITSTMEQQQLKERRHNNNQLLKNQIQGQKKESLNSQQFYAQYVTQRGVYAGIITIKQDFLRFDYIGHDKLPKNQLIYQYSTSKYHKMKEKANVQIPLTGGQLFTRRYILRHTAIQIFNNKRSFFFNLFFDNAVKQLINVCKNKIECIVDRVSQFKRRKFTQKWQNNILSNFQYLMLVNRYSGRTYNDLGQYYVFPWVLNQFSSKQTQIDKSFIKRHIRNLQYPIGKLGQQKFLKCKDKFESVKQMYDQNTYFMYGTMYSNPTVLYNYFIRLEPFITLHWHHQSEKIDHADRLFFGIKQLWNSVLSNSGDMRQLTPQFYYWPQFLKNRNQIYLGKRQDRREVNDVVLPDWAENPQQFIFKMREALQSPEVSKNLGKWIDLIFGYKAMQQNAAQYDNLYQCKAYQNDLFAMQFDQGTKQQAIIEQIIRNQTIISEYGQIPEILFAQQHPQRQKGKVLEPDSCKGVAQSAKSLSFSIQQQGIFCYGENEITLIRAFMNASSFKTEGIKKFQTKGNISKLISMRQLIWMSINEQTLRIYKKKKEVFQMEIQSEAIQLYFPYVIYGNCSQLVISVFNPDTCVIQTRNKLYGHQNQIQVIKTNKFLDLLVSVDSDGLTIVHQLKNFKFMRQFKLDFEPSQEILSLEVHQMGYFIFMTTFQNLWIFTYNGQLYLKQSIDLINSKGDKQQKITVLKVLYQDQPILLISSNLGNIYQVDFLKLKRFNSIYPFKKYSRIKKQTHLFVTQKAKKQLSTKIQDSKILNFEVLKTEGNSNSIPIYKIIVLYETGDIIIFYEKLNLQKHLKKNSKLFELGFF